MRIILAAACFFLAGLSRAEPSWLGSMAEALSLSKSTGKPILMDFQAPWCYSCYYMEKNVLTRPAFLKKAEDLVLLKVDVDLPEGRALKERYRVAFLPTYVLADPKGEAKSRIIGEQTEKDFLDKLGAALTLAPVDPDEEAVRSLRARLAADEFNEAASLVASLPQDKAARLKARSDWKILAARTSLMRAVKAEPPRKDEGLRSLGVLLSLEASCALAYDIDYAQKLLGSASAAEKKNVRESERGPLETLANGKIFSGVCADLRTGIAVLADVYEGLGLAKERAELLDRALAYLENNAPNIGDDRNRDDNLRFFLELKEDDLALRRLYPRLIEAYSSDYVYAHRFAKYLAGRKDFAAALVFSEKADKLCYGANRLAVTKVRAAVLAGLGRQMEGSALLKRDIKANKKAFPKEAEALESLLKELSK